MSPPFVVASVLFHTFKPMARIIVSLTLISLVLFLPIGCSRAVNDAPGNSVSDVQPWAVNINTATLDELQLIPHVGEKVAARIVEHREVNGPFRRVEHLMLIQGISDKRFRKIRPLVRVE